MNDEFKAIPGYDKYFASKDGVVLSRAWGKHRILSKWVNSNGYMTVKTGMRHLTIHRAVALAWIPNESNLSDVNHIDGDKFNNSVENLEWCSRAENIYHALRTGLHDRRETPVVGIHKVTGEVVRFFSQAEAGRNGFTQANIGKCLAGERPYHKGFAWRYDESSVT